MRCNCRLPIIRPYRCARGAGVPLYPVVRPKHGREISSGQAINAVMTLIVLSCRTARRVLSSARKRARRCRGMPSDPAAYGRQAEDAGGGVAADMSGPRAWGATPAPCSPRSCMRCLLPAALPSSQLTRRASTSPSTASLDAVGAPVRPTGHCRERNPAEPDAAVGDDDERYAASIVEPGRQRERRR